MCVGNDVVDLSTPYARNKANDRRFVERVFNEDECAYIAASEAPTFSLWRLWAAKETVFKIASKLVPGLAFSHRQFRVVLDEERAPYSPWYGAVDYARRRFSVRWDANERYIHCVGVDADTKIPLNKDDQCIRVSARAEDRQRFSRLATPVMFFSIDEIDSSAHHDIDESLRVRQLAARLLAHVYEGEVEIVREHCAAGLCPPAVYREGRRVHELDISLSHDGNFVAAAVMMSPSP